MAFNGDERLDIGAGRAPRREEGKVASLILRRVSNPRVQSPDFV
jgi:hypothetical protein